MTGRRAKVYRDAAGEWRWTVFAANGEPLAVSSEAYGRKRDAESALLLVTTGGSTIEVDVDAEFKE